MKRAFRIIVPLILALALVAGTAWYFLVYDQAFTKELLLTQARKFETTGNHKISTFLYNLAYRQSSQEDQVAIELANQYLKDGNYTKAEYTLSQAIAANATAELYVALCDVYVQQDKLLDAVTMLDTITDLALWTEIQQMRPKAPTLDPEPGFYSTYLTITVADAPGKLYLSADGDYPSITKDLYQEDVTLSTGETVIYALRVGENNLVSPLTVCGYTVGGVVEAVVFTDEAMEQAIREAMEATDGRTLYTDELWVIEDFTVPENAKSFEDLKFLPYLKSLTIPKESEGDLTVLAALSRLESLSIQGRKLSSDDLISIAGRRTLTALSLPDCSLSSITELEALTGLTYLDLTDNTLRNLAPISAMKELKELYLGSNAVNDLAALKALKNLEVLDVSYNSLATLDQIFGLRNLQVLRAGNNQIGNILGISELQKLKELNLEYNNITEVKMLTALVSMEQLDLSNNAITSILGLETMAHLHNLDVSYNQITELPPFPKNSELVTIDLSHNQVTLLDPLAGLSWLNIVNADYNPEIADLLPLNTCEMLLKVNVYGTKVTVVNFLTAKSIIVNFDPTIEQ